MYILTCLVSRLCADRARCALPLAHDVGVIIVTDEAQAQATGHDPTNSSSRGTKTAYSASPLQICKVHAMMP